MKEMLQYDTRIGAGKSNPTLTRAIVTGLIGGLVGTFVMDLFSYVMFLLVDLPPIISLNVIGDTAARFFSGLGINIAGGFPLGVLVHYLFGPVLGAIFAALLFWWGVQRVGSIPKGTLFGILYIEVVSQPILATAPLILKFSTEETLQWFGICSIIHFVYGAVLGLIVSYGLKLSVAGRHK